MPESSNPQHGQFEVISPLKFNGKRYEIGATVELSEKQASDLLGHTVVQSPESAAGAARAAMDLVAAKRQAEEKEAAERVAAEKAAAEAEEQAKRQQAAAESEAKQAAELAAAKAVAKTETKVPAKGSKR